MFPTFRQRLIILAATIIGAVVWWWAHGLLLAGDALSGISLFDAQVGPMLAIVLIIAAGIPAIGLGVFASATGNPLSGVFIIGVSLTAVAGAGGGIQGFLWRSSLPRAYGLLIVEVLIWLVGEVLVLYMIGQWSRKLGGWLGPRWRNEHLGTKTDVARLDAESVVAGLVAAAAGALLTDLLIQSPAAGQAIGSLLVAFTIAGLLAQMIVPQSSLLPMLVSPLLVAVGAYGYVMLRYTTGDQVLAAFYARSLPGVAMALPIFYVSAGVTGVAMGIGLGQAFEHARAAMEVEAKK